LRSVEKLLIGPALIVLCAGLSIARGDDPFEMPLPANPPADPNAAARQPMPADPTPADPSLPAPPPRWARRSAQLREAAQQQPQNFGMAPPPMPMQPMPNQPMAQQPQYGIPQAQYGMPQPQYGMPPQRVPYGAPYNIAQRPTGLPGQPNFQTMPVPGANPTLPTPGDKVTKASELRKITTIQPFLDYEPDPEIAKKDPCQNLCPRPEGCPPAPGGRTPDCPKEIPLAEGPYQPPVFAPTAYNWEASNIWYNPLYFEDDQLERYGHAWPFFIQPVVSCAQFTVQAIGLPYQMVLNPPHSVVYPLGHYRPGECAPKLIYQIPWNTHAAIVEAAAITGTIFLFPHGTLF
jgi:hypothetical protein